MMSSEIARHARATKAGKSLFIPRVSLLQRMRERGLDHAQHGLQPNPFLALNFEHRPQRADVVLGGGDLGPQPFQRLARHQAARPRRVASITSGAAGMNSIGTSSHASTGFGWPRSLT